MHGIISIFFLSILSILPILSILSILIAYVTVVIEGRCKEQRRMCRAGGCEWRS
jgi:hypothetical protein